ncbi:MAG: SDR family oxidoreductase [Planctomycetes bacterium]|nr:SDR family oxidoreductase [Planctomycetota bacterium]
MHLDGKKALVTGASRGIGRAIALAFADEGADVAITARKVESLGETADEIKAKGRKAYPIAWDVLDIPKVDERLAEVKENLGGLDIVVNNAGVNKLPKDHPNPTPEAEWDYVMDINLKAVYFICKGVAKLMEEQKSGVIINIASDAGLRNAPHPYGISKWGVVGFTEGLAKQMAPHGVRVNAIAPGPVATDMMGWHPGKPLDAPNLPLKRYSLPEEIAGVAVFLASENSTAVVGDAILINSNNT